MTTPQLNDLAIDERIAGSPRYYLRGDPERNMQVPDTLRKSVVFLAYNAKNGAVKLCGTAFFLSVPLPEVPGQGVIYLVTARHCIEQANNSSIDAKVLLRMNLRAGGTAIAETMAARWIFPEDERIDVALIAIGGDEFSAKVEFHHLPVAMCATDEVIASEGIGIGDEVFVIGLFTQHFGQGSNIPILRAGNISSMPHEKVRTKRGQMDAILVECRSIGGLSGSPVFVHLGTSRILPDGKYVTASGMARYHFLGVMHGHWDLPLESDAPLTTDGAFDSEKLNMGIGVVVPASQILALIDRPDLVAMRDLAAKRLLSANLPTTD